MDMGVLDDIRYVRLEEPERTSVFALSQEFDARMSGLTYAECVTDPRVRRGYRRRQPIWLSDVVPTMCHIVGWRWPKDADGKVAVDFLER
ncbi:MAG: hypothetical protein DRQ14_09380 [Candidatus Latescibacterota bacterium]|nr:MAG: hypothetical protein DRQ14_09380 [Candidatus Latescibacterota bacterium]